MSGDHQNQLLIGTIWRGELADNPLLGSIRLTLELALGLVARDEVAQQPREHWRSYPGSRLSDSGSNQSLEFGSSDGSRSPWATRTAVSTAVRPMP